MDTARWRISLCPFPVGRQRMFGVGTGATSGHRTIHSRRSYRRRLALASAAAVAAAMALVAPPAQAHPRPDGWGTGTLTDAELHSLVAQMTLSEEGGMVHGEGDP